MCDTFVGWCNVHHHQEIMGVLVMQFRDFVEVLHSQLQDRWHEAFRLLFSKWQEQGVLYWEEGSKPI